MTHSLEKLRADYLRWHPAQVDSLDIDPVYPMLRWLADQWDLDEEERAWLVFTHVIWYHPGSTLVGYEIVPDVGLMPGSEDALWSSGLLDLPCETERRGHRPKPQLIKHLQGLRRDLNAVGGAWAWSLAAIAGAGDQRDA